MLNQANGELPVTLGSHVNWYPKAERWRIEVTYPQTMKAVWIAHNVFRRITEMDTHDPELVSGLVRIHRAEIEQHIQRAEMENWKDALARRSAQGVDDPINAEKGRVSKERAARSLRSVTKTLAALASGVI
jgi:hypothetical protein